MAKEKEEPRKLSRKEFVKGAAAVAGAGALASCAPAATPVPTTAPADTQVPCPTCPPAEECPPCPAAEGPAVAPVVYDTDVLVIGGGVGGIFAATSAFDRGANVIQVDKGVPGFSGASGLNWGHGFNSNELAQNPEEVLKPLQTLVKATECIGNQDNLKALLEGMHELKPILGGERVGQVFERNAEGNATTFNEKTGYLSVKKFFPCMSAKAPGARGVKVLTATMVTSLLTSDGAVVGATAIDMNTGQFIVFRAKSTILATGSHNWAMGYGGRGSLGGGGKESTGDGPAMAYRVGAKLVNFEFYSNTWTQGYPDGMAAAYVGLSGWSRKHMVFDKDGDYFLTKYPEEEITRGIFTNESLSRIAAGKGSPHGGVFVDWSGLKGDLPGQDLYRAKAVEKYLGYPMVDAKGECIPSATDSQGRPLLNAKCETTVPGLYATASFLPLGGSGVYIATQGYIAGKNAGEDATKIGSVGVDWDQVNAESDRIYGLLDKEPEGDKLRSHIIRRRIQETMYKALFANMRSEEGLNECIAELERIKQEDLPKIYCMSKNRTYNTEWFEALEAENMLFCCDASARAALMRTESRMTHLRSDYFARDNENWLAEVVVSQVDGKMTLEKSPAVATLIPVDELKNMLEGVPL